MKNFNENAATQVKETSTALYASVKAFEKIPAEFWTDEMREAMRSIWATIETFQNSVTHIQTEPTPEEFTQADQEEMDDCEEITEDFHTNHANTTYTEYDHDKASARWNELKDKERAWDLHDMDHEQAHSDYINSQNH